MKEFIKHLIAKGYSRQTREGILKLNKRFTAWLTQNNIPVETITYNHILKYIQQLQQQGCKQATIKGYTISLKHYLNYLADNNYIPHNPIQAIKIQGIKRNMLHTLLSAEELEQIYNSYNSLPPSGERKGGCPPQHLNQLARQRNKIILGFFIYQGITVHDLHNIQLTHINIKQGLITIPSTRRSNERTLKLEAHQIFELHQYITEVRPAILTATGKQGNQLFTSIGKSDKVINLMQKLLSELRTLNSQLTSIDQIRASVISNWLKSYNLRKVQYMAGHRYVSSTERYQSGNIEQLQDIINKHILSPEE